MNCEFYIFSMELNSSQLERYSRTLNLYNISKEDIMQIMKKRIAMVGAGGIGSPTLRLLTSVGFGNIRIIDGDVVELSNIQRQNIYDTTDIGKPKAPIAAKNLRRQNPEVSFESISEWIDEKNAEKILSDVDIIVDGLDSFESRRIVNQISVNKRIPYIFAGAVEYFANLSTFIPGKTGCFYCTLGNAKDNPSQTASAIGVSPALLSIVAGIAAHEAIYLAIGASPKLTGKLMTIDLDSFSFDLFDIARAEDCPVCSKLWV